MYFLTGVTKKKPWPTSCEVADANEACVLSVHKVLKEPPTQKKEDI